MTDGATRGTGAAAGRLRSLVGLALAMLAGAAAAPAQAPDTVVLDLEEAERRALRYHPLLDRARKDLELSEARRTRASHATLLPRFNLRNVWGPIPRQRGEFTDAGVLTSPDTSKGISDLRWFTQVDLQLTQPLYTFGRADALESAARSGVDASEANLAGTRAEVKRQVRDLYWGVVLGRELQEVAGEVMDRVEEAEGRLREQYEAGDATQNDLFKFRIFEYRAQKRRREATTELEKARAGLRALVGLDSEVPYRVGHESLRPVDVRVDSLDLDRLMALARRNRPQLDQLRAGIDARRELARASRRERWPDLFVGAEVSLNQAPSRFEPDNPFWEDQTNFFRPGLAVGFNWDLNFIRHRDEARIQRYRAEKQAAALGPLELKVREEVRAKYLEARRARNDLEGSRDALTASENWLRAEMQTLEIGINEIQDVIDAFRANVEMELEHLRNIREYNTALAELSRAVGVDLYERRESQRSGPAAATGTAESEENP